MIKTILFIIVIAIIAYFIYRSFNEAKLKGGEELSDDDIWGTVDYVINNGNNDNSEYIPSNYQEFPDNYKHYLMFEYAKGINAYHKKYNNIIKFDDVTAEVTQTDKNIHYNYKYKYTNNNVELTIEVSDIVGYIESCYLLRVKCDGFTDTDSNTSYRQLPNDTYRPLSSQNETDNDYEARTRVGLEDLNNSNSDIGRTRNAFANNLDSLAVSSDSDNDSTIKQPIIEPVMNANENTNSINNNDDKENTQEAETTYKAETSIEQETEKKAETSIDNQTTEQTNIIEEQDKKEDSVNDNIQTTENEKKLFEVFQRAANYMNNNHDNTCQLNTIIVLKGFDTNKLSETLKNQDFVYQIFNKFNTENKYSLVYSEFDGWTIQLSNLH